MSFNKYARSLTGQSVIGFVGKNAAYTTQTTLTLFATNGAQGEIGIFNPNSGALYTTALTEGAQYVIAQIRDGFVKMSPVETWSATTPVIKRNYVAGTAQVSTVTFTYSGDGLSQDTFELKIIETTPLSQHLPVYNFALTDAVGVTADSIAQAFVTQINSFQTGAVAPNPTYTQSQPIVTATWGGAGTGQIVLTAIDTNSHFRVAFSGPDTIAYTYTLTAAFNPATGTAAQVAYIEAEAFIDDSGVGTNYPRQALPGEFKVPTGFTDVVTPGTYNQYFINTTKTEYAIGINDIHPTKSYVYIAGFIGSGVDTSLTTVLAPSITI